MKTVTNPEEKGQHNYTQCKAALEKLDALNQNYFKNGDVTTMKNTTYVIMKFPDNMIGDTETSKTDLRAAMYDFMDGEASKRRRRGSEKLVGHYEITNHELSATACSNTFAPTINPTNEPTTALPTPATTAAPTTATPTTAAPTLAPVNTSAPVTAAPVTAAPVTASPGTATPTTAAPTTAAPVAGPTFTNFITCQGFKIVIHYNKDDEQQVVRLQDTLDTNRVSLELPKTVVKDCVLVSGSTSACMVKVESSQTTTTEPTLSPIAPTPSGGGGDKKGSSTTLIVVIVVIVVVVVVVVAAVVVSKKRQTFQKSTDRQAGIDL